MSPIELKTSRLLLRGWRESDRQPFARLNADPEVMECFPAPLTLEKSNAMVDRIEAEFEKHGYGLWAVEVAATGEFIGFTGLAHQTFRAHFTPAVEVGWRLARSAWGHGYATEAARAALAFGFEKAGLEEIVSFTSTLNRRSIAVMERIGMLHDPKDDFNHPVLAEDSPLLRHVLYRISASRWRSLKDVFSEG